MNLDRDRVERALPDYEIGDEIGRGGWGVVLHARHRQLGRDVAVKELPTAFAADRGVQHRFISEARLLATLDHPHIVPIYDYVEREGVCLLVMELLSGGTVLDRLTTTGVSADTACSIVLATCSALHHAHGKGILHRDVKPENLLFTAAGTLKVSDFGIAKVVGGAVSMATRTGEVLGTPAYMAPEQALGRELTPATDIYAVGTVLYELLSGRLPFVDDGNAIALLYRHVHEDPVPLGEAAPGVPNEVSNIVMRALAHDPAKRYESAEDFGVALADAAGGAWGPGWVQRGGVEVMASGRIRERISQPMAPPPSEPPSSAPSEAPGLGEAQTRSPASVSDATPRAKTPAPPTVIERSPLGHDEGPPGALDSSPDELVPVRDLVPAETPPSMTAVAPPEPPAPTAPPEAAAPAPPPAAASAPAAARRPAPARPPPRRSRRTTLLVALGVVGVLIGGGVGALMAGGGGSSSKSPPRTTTATTAPNAAAPKVVATVPIGERVDHVGTGGQGVWATDIAGHALARIDPATNDVTHVALEGGPHSVAVADNAVWASMNPPGLVKVEPKPAGNGFQVTPVTVDESLNEVALGEGGVWATVLQGGLLVRIDPGTGATVAKIPVGASPDSVVAGEGGAWVANRTAPGTVTRVDPKTNAVVATIPVGANPDQLAIGAGSVWTANSGDGTVSRIDPATNKVIATIQIGAGASSIIVGRGAAWVVQPDSAVVSRIDPATNRVTATVHVSGRPESIAVNADGVWVADTSSGNVIRIRT